MRILLVRPPFIDIKNGPPIGLAYISKVLKDAGHEVSVFDINIDINKKFAELGPYTRDYILPESHPALAYAYNKLDDYCEQIRSCSPAIVGFSLSYPTVKFGIAAAEKLAENIRCIAGGPQATYNEQQLLDTGCFDTVVSGYGEEAVLEAIAKKGIISRKLDKRKEYFPDFSDIPIEDYNGRLPVITARGCPNKCTFCTQHLPPFFHSIESTVAQIKNTPNIREVMYNDSNINMIPDRTEQLFNELAKLENSPEGHVFGLEIKPGFEKYISKMAAANVKIARVGVESGSLRERESMNKPFFSNDTAIELLKETTANKIKTWVQFIFCYPDQTEEDRQETLNLMNRINESCDADYIRHFWYRFVVHHGTEDFFRKRYGVHALSPQQWENSLYPGGSLEGIIKKYLDIIPANSKILF